MSITWRDARDDSEWRSGWMAVAWTLALAIGEALGKRWGRRSHDLPDRLYESLTND